MTAMTEAQFGQAWAAMARNEGHFPRVAKKTNAGQFRMSQNRRLMLTRLNDGPMTRNDYAAAFDADPKPLLKELKVLAGYGLVEAIGGAWRVTPSGASAIEVAA